MRLSLVIAVVFVLLASGGAFARAPDDARTLELVERLKEVIQRAERNRVDGATVNQLKDLVKRYDWPWRVRVLFDDFSDGDFAANPTWNVSRGDFRVIRGAGLRTYVGADSVTTPSQTGRERERSNSGTGSGSAIEGILGGILRGVLEPGPAAPGNQLRGALATAEISTPVGIVNVFAVKVRLLAQSRNPEGSRVEFGPYRGGERDWGYRVAYTAGPKPSLEILRTSPGRSAVVQRYDGATGLEDGRAHFVELRRDRDATMLVLVDGKELMHSVDKGVNDFFDGFTIVNLGGEYNFERVEIYGADK